jgi:hypothetical protein
MTLFDAAKGKKAVSDEVETKSHEFAALFEDLPPRKQRVVLDKMNELLSDPDSIDSFTAGNYAQNSSGQPAQALGAGSSGVANDPAEAIKVILADTSVDAGFKHLIRRAFDQSAPDHIEVEADGTPKELKSTRKERDDAKDARKKAEDKLAEEQDENKSGSLANQLKAAKAAQAAPATPADMVAKADVKPLVDELEDLTSHLTAPMGQKVRGKQEVTDKVAELKAKVS